MLYGDNKEILDEKIETRHVSSDKPYIKYF